LASAFRPREISPISVARFSAVAGAAHELQVVDHDKAELAALAAWRRARARSSALDSAGVSSMKIADFESRSTASVSRPHSSLPRRPGAKVLLVDPALRADHPQREL
jgi:hypothetical protein